MSSLPSEFINLLDNFQKFTKFIGITNTSKVNDFLQNTMQKTSKHEQDLKKLSAMLNFRMRIENLAHRTRIMREIKSSCTGSCHKFNF